MPPHRRGSPLGRFAGRRRRTVAAAAAATLAVVVGLGSAVPASAAGVATSQGPTSIQGPTSTQRNCVVELAPVTAGSGSSSVLDARCFDTFARAIGYATGGDVRLPAGARHVTRADLAAGAGSGALLGIEYEDSGYAGATLSLTGGGDGCYSGATYSFPRLSAYGFNNEISSARVYNNCFGTHYSGRYYGGSQRTCYSDCSGLEGMNDRTSSITFW